MVRVDIYTSKTWKPEKATYRLGSAIIASALSTIVLIFLGLQGAGTSNYGLAISSLLLIVIGLFAGFARPKLDDVYRVAPRPPLEGKTLPSLLVLGLVYALIGIVNKVVVGKELSLLAADSTNQQIAILAGSGVSENLFIGYLLFSSIFNALLLAIGNYWFSAGIALATSSGVAWVDHFFVYGLDPTYFIFVFTSFAGMGILYWLTGSIMLTIAVHVWWNIGGLVWVSLGLPTIAIPGVGCLPYCATIIPGFEPFLFTLPLIGLAALLLTHRQLFGCYRKHAGGKFRTG